MVSVQKRSGYSSNPHPKKNFCTHKNCLYIYKKKNRVKTNIIHSSFRILTCPSPPRPSAFYTVPDDNYKLPLCSSYLLPTTTRVYNPRDAVWGPTAAVLPFRGAIAVSINTRSGDSHTISHELLYETYYTVYPPSFQVRHRFN